MCCKIASAWSFSRIQLPHELWYKLEGNDGYIGSSPFFLATDGSLFVYFFPLVIYRVKNTEVKERELSEEERKAYAAFDYEIGPAVKGSTGAAVSKKEKGIVITVKK